MTWNDYKNAKFILLLKTCLIPNFFEGETFQYDRVTCHRSCTTQQSLNVESVPRLKDWPSDRTNLNVIEQMGTVCSSEESRQSWRIVGTQSQRIATYSCEDSEKFKRILNQLFILREPHEILAIYSNVFKWTS